MSHIGKKIEEVVRARRIPIVEFAKQINTTRNNTYNIFTRDSIDTELLRKIGEILEFDFFCLLSKTHFPFSGNQNEIITSFPGEGINLTEQSKETLVLKVEKLRKENQQLKERLIDKEEIIKLMRGKTTN